MNEKNIGKILRGTRTRLRLSPGHAAYLLGITRDEVLDIERGTKPLSCAITERIIYNGLQSLYEKKLKRNLGRWRRRYPHLFTAHTD